MNDLRNFSDIFRKNVSYDNIKSQKKSSPHPLSRKYICGKTTGENQIDPPPQPF